MSNPTETDYEKQFREDLEKATALSMETLALDQYRRNKLQYSHSDVSTNNSIYKSSSHNILPSTRTPTTSRPVSVGASSSTTTTHFLQNSLSTGSLAQQPPAIPPRKSSETRDEPDLISFNTSPTSAAQQSNSNATNSHSSFVQMVDEMHKLNAQLQEIQRPFNMAAAAQPPPQFGFHSNVLPTPPPPVYNNPAGLQLVPYQQQPQQNENVRQPLTPEQLNKLYSMSYAVQPYHQRSNVTAAASTIGGPGMMYRQPIIAQQPAVFAQSTGQIQMPMPQQHQNIMPNPFSQQAIFMPTAQQQSINVPMPMSQINNVSNIGSVVAPVPQLPIKQYHQLPTLNVTMPTTPSDQPSTSSGITEMNRFHVNKDVIRRQKKPTGDLIDLGNGIDDNRVSVLEAFDPLLMGRDGDDDDKEDNASDCATSYYSESDPFDYLYSGGTQYSDPVYEAVNKIDRTPLSPGAPNIGWNIPSGNTTSLISPPPPLPPRNLNKINFNDDIDDESLLQYENKQINLDRRKADGSTKLYENVVIKKTYDPELVAFYQMVKDIRLEYKYNDRITNVGHVVASEFNNVYPSGTSIKLLVHPAFECFQSGPNNDGGTEIKGQIEGYSAPIVFTCDICTTVEHVIMHVFCELEGQISGSVADYMLKPIGVTEWLSPSSKLSQLECVHDSLKLEQDVQLGLCSATLFNTNAIARTLQDDIRDSELKLEDILAHEPVDSLNYDNLMILLETLEIEIAKLESNASDRNPHIILSCSGVTQAVKAICALLGTLDTIEITDSIDCLKNVCANGQTVYSYRGTSASSDLDVINGKKLDILSESGDYAEVQLRPKTIVDRVQQRCNIIRDSVQLLLETYSNAFRVDFSVNIPTYRLDAMKSIPISNVTEPVMVHLLCLHRPPAVWRHDDYMLGAQIYHGTRYIGDAVVTQCSNEISGLFPRLRFDSWLNFEMIPICTLPRESRLIFVLYGCTTEPIESGGGNDSQSTTQSTTNNASGVSNGVTTESSSSVGGSGGGGSGQTINGQRRVTKIELGWSAIQFFDFTRNMIQGSYLLPLWPPTTDKFLGPAPAKGTHPHGYECPAISIEIPNYGGRIVFPEPLPNHPIARRLDFNSLDHNLQQELIDTAEQGYPSAVDKREVLWEKRYYLHALPHALPKILHAAHSWDFASLVDLHALIRSWQPLSPLQALELFLPRYPDLTVREHAVRWISAMPTDQMVDFLPQLLQALKHDTYEASPMAALLLRKSLESPRIAHHLYWLLVHSLPGESPQNSINDLTIAGATQSDETALITQARYHRRNQIMLRALLAICGEKLSARFLAQYMMCRSLAETATNVKLSKESLRQKTLIQGMEYVNQMLLERTTSLPLGPGQEVFGVNSRTSSFFNSNTLPLKINFIGADHMPLPAIFKAGDDLQQDMLTIQLVRVMDKLWLREGLDLKMVTFNCVPTGYKRGMIEMISDAETLRKIQVEWGLTGSFKDKPIAEWLARQNPSQLEYQRAVDNFTVSCAGYSVATYILGICDRHNDNIMLKTSGHLFHIDFGKFLGDAQMFGNFKRDRTPFVLTSDMAYVINGGDRPSTKFHHFVDLCCQAFNIVRRHSDLLLHMLALMATSGIPGVTADAVNYVRTALLPGQSNPEAAASFAKMIHISLKSWFTQFNFFLHNLAQLRFSGDEGNGELLNFVPRTYTMAQDGRLKSVTVVGFQKRYDMEKYYTFILQVARQNQPDPAYLFRSYKEFLEFHQKLCLHYPLAKLHSLPSGIHVGRSNIKTVAERRLPEIRLFLISLFNSTDEIAHSDLVYTFFHPLLRDQQEQDIHVAKVKDTRPAINPTERVCGEIKLSLQYHRGALILMIHHARSLPATTSGQEPNTYVKAYLKPDPTKVTKRKTKVVRKNCFPSFMETLEYRMPLEYIQNRILQVTVWSHDSLQENEFLGGVELQLAQMDLKVELAKWFPLGYLSRA